MGAATSPSSASSVRASSSSSSSSAAFVVSVVVLILSSLPPPVLSFASTPIPTWSELEVGLPKSESPPVFSAGEVEGEGKGEGKVVVPPGLPIFYRDSGGMCPYSARVWLALESKGVEYATALVDVDVGGSDTAGLDGGDDSTSIPRIMWPDGTVQAGSMNILESIDGRYPDSEPRLFPRAGSMAADLPRTNSVRFGGVFPKRVTPSILAPYLRDADGGVLPRQIHEVVVEEFDEILDEYDDGPYLCGDSFTCADVVWAPFMDRYASQLPVVHPAVEPRGGDYGAAREWYDVLERTVPAWICRVMGDSDTWCRALGEDGLNPDNAVTALPKNRGLDEDKVWGEYASLRPHVAKTPGRECASVLIRRRGELIDLIEGATKLGLDEADEALREVCAVLRDGVASNASKMSGGAREVASFLSDGWLSVPRDMGRLPGRRLRELAKSAPGPRIP